jgi:hypothetical protein
MDLYEERNMWKVEYVASHALYTNYTDDLIQIYDSYLLEFIFPS